MKYKHHTWKNLLFIFTNMTKMHISRWQTFIGAVLLLLSGKLGWVEMSRITRYYLITTVGFILDCFQQLPMCVCDVKRFVSSGFILCYRSAALSWLPGSLLFVGNIYAGSRALSRIVRHITSK